MIELNGKMVNVAGLEDCVYYVEKFMGTDFAREIEYFLKLKVADAEQERDIYKQELESYERSAEIYTFAMSDAYSAVTEMMRNTRITKAQKSYVDAIYDAVKNF